MIGTTIDRKCHLRPKNGHNGHCCAGPGAVPLCAEARAARRSLFRSIPPPHYPSYLYGIIETARLTSSCLFTDSPFFLRPCWLAYRDLLAASSSRSSFDGVI